jgi:hypothetical protein
MHADAGAFILRIRVLVCRCCQGWAQSHLGAMRVKAHHAQAGERHQRQQRPDKQLLQGGTAPFTAS